MHSHHDHAEGSPSASIGEDEVPVDPEQLAAAQAVMARHRQQVQARIEACALEVQEVLDRHGMTLEASRPTIGIVPVTM